jgi:hypothetical protein
MSVQCICICILTLKSALLNICNNFLIVLFIYYFIFQKYQQKQFLI